MSTIRSADLFVTSQLKRWLQWIAEIESKRESKPEDSVRVSADAVAERILREYVLQKFPGIDKVESKYWAARGKLDDEAVNELKQAKPE